jgi:class 3 adenylate cyclase
MKRRMAAILAADVAGFSRLVAEDEEETLRRLPSYRKVFDDFVAAYGGRIFNTAGDSVMCAFDSAVDAVRAAIDIQESLRTRNLAYPPSRRMMYRIGVTIGDVVEREGDLLGDAVNIASRLESLAEPGGVCVARSVHESVVNKIAVPFRDIGPRELKNIPQPVHAFVVAWPGQETVADAVPPQSRDAFDRARDALDQKREALDRERDALDRDRDRARGRDERRQARRDARDERRRARDGDGQDDEDRPRRGPTWRAFVVPIVVLAVIFVAIPAFRAVKRTIDGWMPETSSRVATKPSDRPARIPPLAVTVDAPEQYAALAASNAFVEKPRTTAELYHNARLAEARGDTKRARRAYKDYVELREDFIDPHLRLMVLARRDEGRPGLREFYDELAKKEPARVVTLMQALTYEGAEQRSRLEALAAASPEFVPVQYYLADALSGRSGGTQSLADKRTELAALDKVLAAANDGQLAKYFLDRSVEREWAEKAKTRKEAVEAALANAPTKPTASFARGDEGWKVTLTMPEPAAAISYRMGEAGELQSTGSGPSTDPRTGKAPALTAFNLPAGQEKGTLYVTYKDARDNEAGPFEIAFDPALALTEQIVGTLEATPDKWVGFARDRSDIMTINHLIANRCAIAKATVGFDGGPLESTIRLPPCDTAKPFEIPLDADTAVVIPRRAKEVAVQLSYTDGRQSETRTFRRP